ncbi:hypothetical protein FKW77_003813 [Venturia effusa]|uniref:Uncharacterized protein n=1 Tax=Venturia effusa TaxID=50376 RepID=A0A517L320_9PEZI|nr:hypothetical protein FKW77_003813 [Venturia effusa]
MSYATHAMAAPQVELDGHHHSCNFCIDKDLIHGDDAYSIRQWFQASDRARISIPVIVAPTERNIGEYPRISDLSFWVKKAMATFRPNSELLDRVKPFSQELHNTMGAERKISTGLHDLDLIELAYSMSSRLTVAVTAMPTTQLTGGFCGITLEVAVAVILAADATDRPIEVEHSLHSSRVGGYEAFEPWDKLLTGLKCDPPILAQFPFFLMVAQAFTLKANPGQEHYVYTTLMGLDGAKANSKSSDKFASFVEHARATVPKLNDKISGHDFGRNIQETKIKMAKDQITEAGVEEPLVCALKRAGSMTSLPTSPVTKFYDSYYELTEHISDDSSLGVSNNISHLIRDLHRLWNIELRDPNKEAGWGGRFDALSDTIFRDIDKSLSEQDNPDNMYKSAIAFSRPNMTMPYITYHTARSEKPIPSREHALFPIKIYPAN